MTNCSNLMRGRFQLCTFLPNNSILDITNSVNAPLLIRQAKHFIAGGIGVCFNNSVISSPNCGLFFVEEANQNASSAGGDNASS